MATTLVADDYSPIYVGDTLKTFAPVFISKTTKAAIDLTGLTITMRMLNTDDGTVKVCSGTWTIDDATNGKAHYQYQSGDVDTAGTWDMQMKLTDGSGKFVHGDIKVLEIETPI
jgi:hypothetical protein